MNWFNRISSKNKQSAYVPVQWVFEKHAQGLMIRIFRGQESEQISLPVNMTVAELRQQPALETLELIETMWFEEWLVEVEQGYMLPYEKLIEAPKEIRELLEVTEPVQLDLILGHEGAVGSSHFQFVLKKQYEGWEHLERTAQSSGPWLRLPDRNWLLMQPEQYHLQQLINQAPAAMDKERIFQYVAEIRSTARRLNIPMDAYLEKQDYKFADGFDITINYSGEQIDLNPLYLSGDEVPAELLEKMSAGSFAYASDPKHGKIFVSPEIIKKAKEIRNIDPIKGQDIPRFAENPEAYLPDVEGLDLSLFGERVKALGIRVYKAQPYVHASDKGRGWFELETGISIVDGEGEIQQSYSSEDFQSLLGSSASENEYFQVDGQWIKIPSNTGSFSEAAERLRQTLGNESRIDVTKLPYVLEIFENIGQLEFNQPILTARQEMVDQGVLDKVPPAIFEATLKPFQQDGYVWMKSLHYRNLGALLADDMGLGKTIQVVSLLAYLHQIGKLTPTLVVVPKTLIENWVGEIEKFAKPLAKEIYVHGGSSRVKDPEVLKKTGITLTTYQTLVRDQLAFGQIEWQSIICDEAQAIKNPSTAASKVIKAMNTKFRLALTGTPVENGLSELWSILDYVQPGLLGSLSDFKKEFIDKLEADERDQITEQRLLARISMVYKRRTKSEELAGQLPSKTSMEVPVLLGEEQKQLYSEVVSQVKNKKMSGLQAIQLLRELCSHPGLVLEQYKTLPVYSVPKLDKTMQIIKEVQQKGEKVLVFTELRQMQELLRDAIREQFDINPAIINGMTERRQSVVDQFNRKPGFDVMILSPKAAGTGLTITSANHVIHYTRWWNPAVENQATDRVYRIGQERPVQVYYPIVTDQDNILKSGTVEQIVHRILSEKQELASSIVVSSRKLDVETEVMASIFE
ncbi:DEAD/DEAH box helicase [Paenibacillus sp. N4]|uniref:DEAD/DEAH box helicase n=1 Tax=Paenibacillus vietnamensis TaxID=2590547 RepID=UPI001CD17235|nr:DEAD/DEAH box helicase [Paenibacillus vietnamensis]MCA0757008.1 DEAD/DEAH box helicase [Paenibacillus vietnamensis]